VPRTTAVLPTIPGKSQSTAEHEVAALAARQHGVVTRSQLASLGLSDAAIDHRIARAGLHRIHRGVFAVGHRAITREGAWMAAVLAAGPGAVLSHRSAAALWGIRDTSRREIEVTSPRQCRRPAIEAYHVRLARDEATTKRGIPVTTPARTLLDLAAVVDEAELEHAFDEAEFRRLTSPTSLGALVARYPTRRGTKAIRRVLANHERNGETVTRSRLERRLLALLDAHDLPRPRINRTGKHGELDATWPEQRLVVECDGFAAHGTREAFERDRARDRALLVAGWRVVRVTWRQLTQDSETIARDLTAILGASPSPRSAPRAHPPRPATRATRSGAAP
jgi:very-short-patch-repair endonuclease/predicted transcriptional regulator of viral defense system